MIAAANGRLRVIGRAGIGVDNVDHRRGDGRRHHRDEHAVREFHHHRRARDRHALRLRPADPRRRPVDAGGQVGEVALHGRRDHRQGARRHRLRQYRLGGGEPRASACRCASSPTIRSSRRSAPRSSAWRRSSSKQLFRRADFITLHTPLTDKTRNIIDAAAIAKMKDGVRIVNCARGGLVVEEALRAALDSGKVAGAAIDVFAEEPATEERALRRAERRLHAASRRRDDRGAGERRRADRRADGGLSDDRRGAERAEHALDHAPRRRRA